MTMSDTISDMLTRIRNSLMAKKPEVVFPYSTFKHNLAKVLQNEGWIAKAEVKEENDRKFLSLQLKYDNAGVDRKSTRLNSSHQIISYAVFCLKKKKNLPSTPRPNHDSNST